MTVIRWANIFCGACLAAFALGFVFFLSSLGDYDGPAGARQDAAWLTLLSILGALYFANAIQKTIPARFGWLVICNGAAAVILAALLILKRDELYLHPFLVLLAVGPVSALAVSWRAAKSENA